MSDEEPTYAYASAMTKGLPAVDTATAETVASFAWTESDKSSHAGTEYHFPPETGLPYLRTEWTPRTDGLSYGLGILFMATVSPATGGGPSDYSFAEADQHPDNEQHYRTALFEPWNLLFPDKSEVWVLNGTDVVDAGTEGAVRVTVDDAIAEAVRRYRENLAQIHPSQLAQLQGLAVDLTQQMIALANQHIEVAGAIVQEDAEAHVPGIRPELVAQVAASDPTLLNDPIGA